jgi:hypothetical protein
VKRTFLQRKYADGRYEQILQEMEGNERVAGISEFLSIKYGLRKGDTIALQTPGGRETFRINDVFSNYATTAGFIYLDRKWLKEYWGLDMRLRQAPVEERCGPTGSFKNGNIAAE